MRVWIDANVYVTRTEGEHRERVASIEVPIGVVGSAHRNSPEVVQFAQRFLRDVVRVLMESAALREAE